jgi:predicted RNase H-like nuclease (RuvC/YqgF family)
MSSSRSVASARARRAGGSETSKPRPTQMRNPAQFQAQAPPTPVQSDLGNEKKQAIDNKLSVSDAFALVTIRLGRVEMALQKLDINNILKSVSDGENSSSIASNVIVKSISSRIDDLERTIGESDKTGNLSEEHLNTIEDLQNKVKSLETELREAKDSIYKLQSFALDANQRLSKYDASASLQSNSSAKDTKSESDNDDDDDE